MRDRRPLGIGLTAAAMLLIAAVRVSAGSHEIHACAMNGNGTLRLLRSGDTCAEKETPLVWSITGPQGPVGPQGPRGPEGPPGADGAPGPAGPAAGGAFHDELEVFSAMYGTCHDTMGRYVDVGPCGGTATERAEFTGVDVVREWYPEGAVFTLKTKAIVFDGETLCVRLADAVTGGIVGGSESCVTAPETGSMPVALRSAPLELTSGRNLFISQMRTEFRGFLLHSQWLEVDWT